MCTETESFPDEMIEVAGIDRWEEKMISVYQDVLSNRQLWSTNMPFPRHPSCGYIRPVP